MCFVWLVISKQQMHDEKLPGHLSSRGSCSRTREVHARWRQQAEPAAGPSKGAVLLVGLSQI